MVSVRAEMRADLEEIKSGKRARQRWHWALVAVLIAVVAVPGWRYRRSHNRPKLTDKDTVMLPDFGNTAGDSVFDETLRQGLSIQLEQRRTSSAVWALHVNLPAPKFQSRLSSSSGERVSVFTAYFSRFFAKIGDWVSIAFAAPRLPPFNRQQILNFFPLLLGEPAFGS